MSDKQEAQFTTGQHVAFSLCSGALTGEGPFHSSCHACHPCSMSRWLSFAT